MENQLKVFISQPMNGRSDREILDERAAALRHIEEYFKCPVIEIESFFDDSEDYSPIYMLGKSIMLMADANLVYFCKEWEAARGCQIEHQVALKYKKRIMYQNPESIFKKK